jgi:ubiquitin conjugation factor E4 B
MEDVVADTDLKAKIEAFKTEKLAGKRREMVQNRSDSMDTST